MALTPDDVEQMIGALTTSNEDDQHHGLIRRYLEGRHQLPYAPPGAKSEYRSIAEKSITNWLPLLPDTFVKGLFVDGLRIGTGTTNAKVWDAWVANGMNARQSVIYRGAIEYGVSYVLVLPGTDGPLIRPLGATRAMAWYEDEDAEWPERAIIRTGTRVDGAPLYTALDDTFVYYYAMESKPGRPAALTEAAPTGRHGLGKTPLVRFRDRLDGRPLGLIKPLIPVQDRINEIVFAWMMSLHFAAFRQRWATGLAIPVDTAETMQIPNEDYDPNGPVDPETNPETLTVANPNFNQPVESFDAAVDRLWTSNSPDTKFGEFAQTSTQYHESTYQATVRTMAAIAQVPPNVLFGEISNVSADALASIYDSTTRKLGEYKTLFGEGLVQLFRLAAKAAGIKGGATADYTVRWRDTEARSLAATVDALGKMVQMMGVPQEATWELIPGVHDTDIERWKKMEAPSDGLTALAAALQKQTTPTAQADPNADPKAAQSVPAGA